MIPSLSGMALGYCSVGAWHSILCPQPPILRRSNVPITRRIRSPNRWADRLRARAVPRGVDGGGNGAPRIVIELRPNFFTRWPEPFCGFEMKKTSISPPSPSPSPWSSGTTLGTTLGVLLPEYGVQGCNGGWYWPCFLHFDSAILMIQDISVTGTVIPTGSGYG